MNRCLHIVLLALSFFSVRCAIMPTSPTRTPASLAAFKTGKTVQLRFYNVHYGLPFQTLHAEEEVYTEYEIEKYLKDSGAFSKVQLYPIMTDDIVFYSVDAEGFTQFSDEKIKAEATNLQDAENVLAKKLQVKWPIQSDILIDIRTQSAQGSYHSPYMHWALLHGLSFGLIPIRVPQDINYTVTAYDKNGKELFKTHVQDQYSVWGWTPLYLVNGYKLISKFEEVVAKQNAMILQQSIYDMLEALQGAPASK